MFVFDPSNGEVVYFDYNMMGLNINKGNIEDLAKIFESAAGTLIVPNNDLKPEKTVTADLGITLWEGKKFQFENNFFITKMYDPIITDNFTLNGQSTIIYNGVNSIITANQNQGQANVIGVSSIVKTYLCKKLLFTAAVNLIKGTITNNAKTMRRGYGELFLQEEYRDWIVLKNSNNNVDRNQLVLRCAGTPSLLRMEGDIKVPLLTIYY